jgi:diadenosine tetraphosphate (Ap4A) HIT family hydrolase
MSEFVLDERLAAAGVHAFDLPLSRVLVLNDARFPRLILVPRRPGLVEICDVDPADRVMLTEEIAIASGELKALTRCHKINVMALGNMVPQFHIHIIARNPGDACWPGPVAGDQVPYEPGALEEFVQRVATMF